MNKKYKLTKNTKKLFDGTILYQIQALKDFSNVKKGDLGGWIEKEDNLSQGGNAWVYGDARVYGNARVYGDARVYGNARVYGDARVYGNARVCGNARVYGDARVYDNARVYGDAWLSAKARFRKGWFIGGDDTGKITDITDETGSDYWEHQYVLGDYEIEPIEEETESREEMIEIDGKKFSESTIKEALKRYIE